MKHLCYIYISEYRCLHDVGIVLNPTYRYSYNKEENNLTISDGKTLPSDFWGAGIYAVAGIFGNNGVGKSTVFRFLLNAIVEGSGEESVNGIVVYEENRNVTIYHHFDNPINAKPFTVKEEFTEISKRPALHRTSTLQKINTFFYMGHFSPELSYNDLMTVGLTGMYNASEGFRLRDDLEKFANTADPYLANPISTYLVSHISQNNYRICRLLVNERLKETFHSFNFPRYIFFAPNRGGQSCLKFNPIIYSRLSDEAKQFLDLPTGLTFKDAKNQYIAQFIHFNLLNAMADGHLLGTSCLTIKAWYAFVNLQDDVLPQFKDFAQRCDYHHKPILLKIHSILKCLFDKAHFNERNGGFYLHAAKDKVKIQELIDMAFRDRFYLTSRFFDLYYSHDINSGSCTLSSGEQEMLNLFSRIYDAIELKHETYDDAIYPSLLLLDEAEIGFHPDWQRNYISTLLDFLHSLYVMAGFNFQVVVSSHSPILLSDIPVCCNNFLKKDENGNTRNVREDQYETFASNVFDSYRNSFFLEDGLIGKHAEQYLKNLKQKIEKGEEDIDNEISLIGDERLKDYFLSLRSKYDKSRAISYYKQKLKNLGVEVK